MATLSVPGLGGALIVGIAITILIELRDRSFRRADEICKTLRLPALAHIPRIERSVMRAVLAVGQTRLAPALVSYHRPSNIVSRRIHYLGSRLLSILEDCDGTILQIMSAHRGEGTTTTLVNLALSLARSGRRVLVVDADFRNASLHAYFGLDSCDGFSEVLKENVGLRDAIHACAEVPDLYVLPAGRRSLISEKRPIASFLSLMLKELRDEFDCILVDCPPVHETVDSIEIGGACDATVIVIKPTGKFAGTAQAAASILRAYDVNVVGVVLNNLSKRYADCPSNAEGWPFYPTSDRRHSNALRVREVTQAVN